MKFVKTKIRRVISNLPGTIRTPACIVIALVLCVPYLAWPPNKAEASISVVGTPTTAITNNSTSMTIDKPTGTVEGDFMLATVAISSTATASISGWTRISPNPVANDPIFCAPSVVTHTSVHTFYKFAGASEGASYSATWTGPTYGAGGITTYKGVDSTTPIDTSPNGYCAQNGDSGGTVMFSSSAGLSTVTNNARVIGVWAQRTSNGNPNSISESALPPSYPAMTERVKTNSAATCGAGCNTNQAAVLQADRVQATAGQVAPGRAVSTQSGAYVIHMFALRPAPAIEQSAYRFSVNADNTTPAYITDNLSTGNDRVNGTTLDAISSVFYTVGDNGTNWVIEKRRVADGALCTASNCGTQFGTGGRIIEDIAASATETAYAVAVDPSGGFIYVVGMDNAIGGGQWRTEKRNMLTGALVSGFGNGGIVVSNPSSGLDEALAVKLDTISGYLYVGGYDGTGNNQWRIEKYRTGDGGLCTAANCGTQFGLNGVYLLDISTGDDRISNLELDPTNTYLYVSGFDAKNTRTQWTMYKLRADSAAACTAAACGTQFGVNGLYNSDPSNRDDKIIALQVDSASGAIYIGGYESLDNSTTRTQWRIEKITLDTGAKVTAFGNNGSCFQQNTGAVCATFSTGSDKVLDMDLDGAGGYVYVIGVKDEAGANSEWQLQKRNRSDGSLVTGWATNGTSPLNPSPNQDPPNSIIVDIDRGLLWAIGGDRTLGTTNMQWYFTQLQLDTGTLWLAPENTIAGASTNSTFRLRLLLHITETDLLATSARQFKLKYAPKVGTCDTAFVGESYADVLNTGNAEIMYHDNPSNTDAAAAVALTGDPTHSSDIRVLETIEESNNFTNTTNVLNGQDGLWDFVLKDNNAFGAYCFKVVNSNEVGLDSYTVIPEVTFCKDDPKTTALLRHGTFFCEGLKKSFFWTQ